MMQRHLRLAIELTPAGHLARELRRRLLPNVRKKIERQLFERAGYGCEVCGARGARPGEDVFQWDDSKEEVLGTKKKVHWDEVWQFDDKKLVARLIRLRALCEDCREVKHLGFTAPLSDYRELALRRVEGHFCRINKVAALRFWHHVKQAERECERRSQYKWKVDYGEYEPLVPKRKTTYKTG